MPTPHEHEHDHPVTLHDGPICSDCEHCTDCCACPPSKPWALLAITWGTVLAGVSAYLLGFAGFDSGWSFLYGLALMIGCLTLIPGGWAAIAVGLAGAIAFDVATPDKYTPSMVAGLWAPLFAAALVGGTWLLTVLYRLHRDAKEEDRGVAVEATKGLDLIDQYLDAHDTVTTAAPARKIIGLSGYAGAGKDTAAAELLFNNDYTRVSFADPIRALALEVNRDIVIYPGEPQWEMFAVEEGRPVIRPLVQVLRRLDGDWTEAKRIPAVRKHLQALGVGVRDVLGDTVWVDTAMRNLPDGPIVVTDCRFPNEAQAIKDAGGYVVRITRPGVDAANAHITDTALDDWNFDAHLINEGTPAEARQQMQRIEDVLYDPDLTPTTA